MSVEDLEENLLGSWKYELENVNDFVGKWRVFSNIRHLRDGDDGGLHIQFLCSAGVDYTIGRVMNFFLENTCYFWAHRNCYINAKAVFCQRAFIINLRNSINTLKS